MPPNQFDIQAITQNTWIRTIVQERTIGSTNTLAVELVSKAKCKLPLLVLADEQTAGRGRELNPWWSNEGSITFSLAVDRSTLTIQPQSLYSLGVGCTLLSALKSIVESSDLALKWPNDVMLRGRKVAGILIETAGTSASALIIGIGINLNTDLRLAPSDVQSRATSVSSILGKQVSATKFLVDLLANLANLFSDDNHAVSILDQYRHANFLVGKLIRIRQGLQLFTGTCMDIDDSGAIVLQTDDGTIALASGTVELFGSGTSDDDSITNS